MKNKLTVSCSDWSREITVDDEIFDDIFIEAATQAIEDVFKTEKISELKLNMVMLVFHSNKKRKSRLMNTYKIMINAGLHKYAETFRSELMKAYKIDFNEEPISASE